MGEYGAKILFAFSSPLGQDRAASFQQVPYDRPPERCFMLY